MPHIKEVEAFRHQIEAGYEIDRQQTIEIVAQLETYIKQVDEFLKARERFRRGKGTADKMKIAIDALALTHGTNGDQRYGRQDGQ